MVSHGKSFPVRHCAQTIFSVLTEFLTTPLNELQIRTYNKRVAGFREPARQWSLCELDRLVALKAGNLGSFSVRILLRELGVYVNMRGFRSPPQTIVCVLVNMEWNCGFHYERFGWGVHFLIVSPWSQQAHKNVHGIPFPVCTP